MTDISVTQNQNIMPGRAAQYTNIDADVLIYQASIQLPDLFQSDDSESDNEDGYESDDSLFG